MKKVVVFLQNAWSPQYAGKLWPRDLWVRALWRSRSGSRLATLTQPLAHESIVWWFDNASRKIGKTPDLVYRPDVKHMRGVISEQEPNCVMCMGSVAARGWHRIGFPHEVLPCMFLPHPAFRLLTNQLYRDAGKLLQKGWSGIVQLKQGVGEVCVSDVTTPI